MAQIRRFGRWMLVLAPLLVLALLLVPQPPAASAAYSTPFWLNNSPSPCGFSDAFALF